MAVSYLRVRSIRVTTNITYPFALRKRRLSLGHFASARGRGARRARQALRAGRRAAAEVGHHPPPSNTWPLRGGSGTAARGGACDGGAGGPPCRPRQLSIGRSPSEGGALLWRRIQQLAHRRLERLLVNVQTVRTQAVNIADARRPDLVNCV